MKPRVSIGIPVYNAERTLERAIAGLQRQTYQDFNVVIADNASLDRTPEICEAVAAIDERFQYVRHNENIGAFRNFNFVMESTDAPLFMWHCHDDYADPEYLDVCVKELDRCPDCVLAYALADCVDEDGVPFERPYRELGAVAGPRAAARFAQLLNPVPYQENLLYGVMRRSHLLRLKGMGCFPGADRVLSSSLALAGPFARIPRTLFHREVRTRASSPEEAEAYYTGRHVKYSPREWAILWANLKAIANSDLGFTERLDARSRVMIRFLREWRLYTWEAREAFAALGLR